MSVFDKSFATEITALIKEVGMSVKVTRQGAAVASGMGVFVGSKSADVQGSSLPGVSNTANTMKTVLVQALSKPPLVGDDITSTQGTFSIESVEAINPAGTVLLYKLECN